MICYTNPTCLAYHDQIVNILPINDGCTDLYVSSNRQFPFAGNNISTDRHKVICNSYDTVVLWKTNYFNTPQEDYQKYVDKLQPYGEIQVYHLYIPKYLEHDTTMKYQQSRAIELINDYDLATLDQLGLLLTCGNQATMLIGHLIIATTRADYAIYCGYNELP